MVFHKKMGAAEWCNHLHKITAREGVEMAGDGYGIFTTGERSVQNFGIDKAPDNRFEKPKIFLKKGLILWRWCVIMCNCMK